MIQFFMLKLHLGGGCMSPAPKFELPIAQEGMAYKFGTRCTKLYKISTKLWSSFLCWNCICGGGCMSPAPKFELLIVQEGMVYKILDSVYKISTKLWYTFRSRNPFWGAGDMHLSRFTLGSTLPKLWIISKNDSNKSCWKLNFLQKLCRHTCLSPPGEELRGSKDRHVPSIIMFYVR